MDRSDYGRYLQFVYCCVARRIFVYVSHVSYEIFAQKQMARRLTILVGLSAGGQYHWVAGKFCIRINVCID